MNTIRLLCLGVISVPMALSAPACVSGSLADYVALGPAGCGFNGMTFSSFEDVTSTLNAVAPSDSSITVGPFAGLVHLFYGIGNEGDYVDKDLYGTGLVFSIQAGLGR